MIGLGIKFLTAKLLHKKIPLLVGWAVTHRCNRRCAYCDLWDGRQRELTTDQVCGVIDDLASLGTHVISFTGGEPLMRDDIGRIIDYANGRKIKTKINTNGSMVKNRIDEIKNINVLTISLDGSEEAHDRLRGKGSYQEAIEAAKIAREKGIRISFASVLTSANAHMIDCILEKAGEFNAPVMFQPVTDTKLGSRQLHAVALQPDQLRASVEKLIALKKKGRLVANSTAGLKHLLNWPEPRKIACASGYISCRIEPNGDVVHCSRNLKSPALNCIEHGFKKAFLHLQKTACSDCWCGARIELNMLWSLDALCMIERMRCGYSL